MSWDGKCKHGVRIHPFPAKESCVECAAEYAELAASRKAAVLIAFAAFIESGASADLPLGIDNLYHLVYDMKRRTP